MTLRNAPATERNRVPILEVLRRWLDQPATVLEIASGTGQHAVYFSAQLPHVIWQPSDLDPESIASIEAWIEAESPPNVRAPIRLDAAAPPETWSVREVDAIFCANMIHISPWRVAEGLFAGAGQVLNPSGRVFLYGPFRIDGRPTSESNAAFDADLRRRDPEWGVRDLEAVCELAASVDLQLVERNDLPANNKLLVFER